MPTRSPRSSIRFAKRQLKHESLESRKLLAAGCEAVEAASFAQFSVAEVVSEPAFRPEVRATIAPDVKAIADPWAFYGANAPQYLSQLAGPDLVQEVGERVYVVDQGPWGAAGTLSIFSREEDGSLTAVAEVDLTFHVESMLVVENNVLLVGSPHLHPYRSITLDGPERPIDPGSTSENGLDSNPFDMMSQTVVMTVSLGDSVDTTTQQFSGHFQTMNIVDGKLVVIGSLGGPFQILIYPSPPVEGFIQTYDVTDQGLVELASATIESLGNYKIVGNQVIHVATSYEQVDLALPQPGDNAPIAASLPYFPLSVPSSSLSRYVVGDDGIVKRDAIELGAGSVSYLHLSEDGLSGTAIRNDYTSGAGPNVWIDLLDFSGETVRVVESIQLSSGHASVVGANDNYLLLRLDGYQKLTVIDTRLDAGLTPEARVRTIELESVHGLSYEAMSVNDDMVVFRGFRNRIVTEVPSGAMTSERLVSEAGDDKDPDFGAPTQPDRLELGAVLVAVSLSEAKVLHVTEVPEAASFYGEYQFVEIDPETSRFGFVMRDYSLRQTKETFLFGRLDDTGKFVREGEIAIQGWLEVDANSERLIARTADSILEFDWLAVDEPVVTPIGKPEPPIEAIDDAFTLERANGGQQWIDVLANDLKGLFHRRSDIEIVRLIDAPAGVAIHDGRWVLVSGEALESLESFEFDYVIRDGEKESQATVKVTVLPDQVPVVERLVKAVRTQAAKDWDVAVERVRVVHVERLIEVSTDPANDANRPGLFGVVVHVVAGNREARYKATVDGTVVALDDVSQESVAELGLRAVDENGEPLSSIEVGETFYLEFIASDLRPGGSGVYAAFFDLVVPSELLEITGPVEYTDGYSGIKTGSFTSTEIDDLGAVSNDVNLPTSARQSLLRIGVTALAAGSFRLQPEAADGIGTETLVHGVGEAVAPSQVRYAPLSLTIVEPEAVRILDVDSSGHVTAGDALEVIRFMNLHGPVSLAEFAPMKTDANGEAVPVSAEELADMHRRDVNLDGKVTALDALLIVNELQRQQFADLEARFAAEGESSLAAGVPVLLEDDDDDVQLGTR